MLLSSLALQSLEAIGISERSIEGARFGERDIARMVKRFVRCEFFGLVALYNLANMLIRWNFSIGDNRSG